MRDCLHSTSWACGETDRGHQITKLRKARVGGHGIDPAPRTGAAKGASTHHIANADKNYAHAKINGGGLALSSKATDPGQSRASGSVWSSSKQEPEVNLTLLHDFRTQSGSPDVRDGSSGQERRRQEKGVRVGVDAEVVMVVESGCSQKEAGIAERRGSGGGPLPGVK